MIKHLFGTIDQRSVGVFAHLTSLPSDFGIGTLGKEAKQFIDFLNSAGFSYWQMCPIGPTGYGDSPYQSFSAFAGNTYFIDFEELKQYKLIDEDLLTPLRKLSQNFTDYGSLYNLHESILMEVFKRFHQTSSQSLFKNEYTLFLKTHQKWLLPYSAFRAFKSHFNYAPWWEWDSSFITFQKAKTTKLYKELTNQIAFHNFIQFLFYHQWEQLRQYSNTKDIKLIGDVPLFVAHDSADLWSNPKIYQLDPQYNPTHLAGVPPDYFSKLGQFWGNPLYAWNKERSNCYAWWTDRLRHNFKLFDVLRLDHFRGFESYWSIPANAPDARTGTWLKGPGLPFFKYLSKEFSNSHFIAEDLGIITEEVKILRETTQIPGMVVLQFAFDVNPKNAFLPHNLTKNFVAYSGTHDNDTTKGWYRTLNEAQKDQIRRYLRISGNEIAWDFIRALYASPCNTIILTMQDLMNKGSEARLNIPGTSQGNWQWRFTLEELNKLQPITVNYLRELKWLYDR